MNLTCPHCSQTLELAPDVLAALQGQPHFACPMCEGLVEVPKPASTEEGAIDAPEVAVPPVKKPKTLVIVSSLGAILAVTVGLFFFLRGSSDRQLTSATKDQPFVNTLGMKFVPVPGTNVLMCIHETRFRDYEAYAAESSEVDPSWKDQSDEGFTPTANTEEHPVVKVSWADAAKFCDWLSTKEGKTYRLPTDKEWSVAVGIGREEKWEPGTMPASVAAHHTTYPWGDDYPPPPGSGNYSDASRKAKTSVSKSADFFENYDDGFPTTAPVMSFAPNFLGLFDMGGNVMEWVGDSDGKRKRGSSCYGMTEGTLASARKSTPPPAPRIGSCGFRCVVERPDGAINQDSQTAIPRIDGLVANGEWQDILDRLDQKRDRVTGEWNRVAKGLECPAPTTNGVLATETSPLDHFEARIRYTSPRHDRFDILLPSPSGRFIFYCCPYRRTVGIGKLGDLVRPLKQKTGGDAIHEAFVTITPQSLRVTLDGEPVYEMNPMDWDDPRRNGKHYLGFGLHQGKGTLHSFEVRIPEIGKK